MNKTAIFIRHKALPGKREQVRQVWERHLKPRAAANPAHEAYFYCFDELDPDSICVFQQYSDSQSSRDFISQPWYEDYVNEVTPLLAARPEARIATTVWAKSH